MHFSTADGRLKKQILFMLVQKCNMDTCYRCGKKIERVEDFSIDHKESWLNVDPVLFWDLDNIAFSHLRCNTVAGLKRGRGAVPYNEKASKAPPGMAWCSGHKDYLPVENFGKSGSRKNGLYHYCRECRRKDGWT